MTYRVVTTDRAARDIEAAVDWWAQTRSAEQAERWYHGIRAAIAGIATEPQRYPLSPERPLVSYEIRELYFGLGPNPTHRIIFTVVKETVLVLTVRHCARRDLTPDDLL